jgi:TRAP transporter TAXI family solute receptor
MDIVMKAKGMKKSDLRLASELKGSEQSKALCDNKIDAMIYVVGHPAGAIKEATTTCNAKLINVTGPVIDKLVADNSFYKYTTIPGGMYKGTPNDVKTFGVAATFVTSSKVSEQVIYAVVKSVFENFEAFKKLHPAFNNLKKEDINGIKVFVDVLNVEVSILEDRIKQDLLNQILKAI